LSWKKEKKKNMKLGGKKIASIPKEEYFLPNFVAKFNFTP
jgi:hypothetical protein